jgi:hypothetical protein
MDRDVMEWYRCTGYKSRTGVLQEYRNSTVVQGYRGTTEYYAGLVQVY